MATIEELKNAKLVTVDSLSVLKDCIPEPLDLVGGNNITLTPDAESSNKITISSPILDKTRLLNVGSEDEPYYYLSFDDKELVYKAEVEALIEESGGGHWIGTSAQYEIEKDNIKEGTVIIFTDDAQTESSGGSSLFYQSEEPDNANKLAVWIY